MAGTVALPSGKPTTYLVRYEGIVDGFAAKGTVTIEEIRESVGAIPSLFGSAKSSNEVLMVISDDKKEIRVWEKGAEDLGKYYSLSGIASDLILSHLLLLNTLLCSCETVVKS